MHCSLFNQANYKLQNPTKNRYKPVRSPGGWPVVSGITFDALILIISVLKTVTFTFNLNPSTTKMILMVSPGQKTGNEFTTEQVCKYCNPTGINCIAPPAFSKKMLGIKIVGACLREQILLVQIFASFPLFGLLLPNVILYFTTPVYLVPAAELVVCLCSITVIGLTLAIQLLYSTTRFAAL
ncbi:hypothetical protein ACFQ3S_18075 [Mucilaginibacter terrae]|uniref:hypothetical protein n=1 Tax=Mucilaginibacter terrae TaxID=1955052 RepID=UPI003627495D